MYNNIKMFLSLAVFRYFAFVLAQINMSLECACHIKYWHLKWQDLDGWSSQVPKMTPELINTRIFTLVFGFCLGLLFYPLLTTHLTKVWINTHTHILINLHGHFGNEICLGARLYSRCAKSKVRSNPQSRFFAQASDSLLGSHLTRELIVGFCSALSITFHLIKTLCQPTTWQRPSTFKQLGASKNE